MRRIFHPDGREGKRNADPPVLGRGERLGGELHALGVQPRFDRDHRVLDESGEGSHAQRIGARVLHGRQFDHVHADLLKQSRDLQLFFKGEFAFGGERAVGNCDLFHFLSFLFFFASENKKPPKPVFGFRDDQMIAVPP